MTRREAKVSVFKEPDNTFEEHDGWTYDEAPGLAIADKVFVTPMRDAPLVTSFSLTHVPTGRTIGAYPDLETAEATLHEIAGLTDWATVGYPAPKSLARELRPILVRREREAWRPITGDLPESI